MSVLRQILGAAAASGRSGGRATKTACTPRAGYSSFSGRYFNSSGKPGSKGAVVAAKGSNSKAKELQPAPQDGTDLVDSTTGDTVADSTSHSTSCTTTTTITNTTTNPSHCTTSHDTSSSPSSHTGQQPNIHLVIEPDFASIQSSTHPVISPQDLKLHQFFSLHRPLLLIHTPPALFDSPPVTTFATSQPQQQPRQLTSVFDDPIDAQGIDADVEAARQLARGLTLNKAGPAVAWEQTLKRLGLDPASDPARVEMQGQMDREWEDVQIMLDSTKRKRRSKMKKHKLKKRRKATRASRLKLK